MFSWSQTATKKSSSSSSEFPGRRSNRSGNANGVHTPVEGSIRPPSTLTRAQQLDSYLEDATLQRSTRRVSSDDTTYDTVFQTTKGDTLIVRVNVPLASSFASFCPAMSLAGVKVKHPWVEPRTMRITGYDPIESEAKWKRSGLTLGEAVHAVVQHLQLNPPEILEISDVGLRNIQPKTSRFRNDAKGNVSSGDASRSLSNGHSASSSSSAGPPSYDTTLKKQQRTPQLPPAPEVPMPSIPRHFDSILNEMSKDELETLMGDEREFLSLVHNMDVFQEIQEIARSKANETKRMARENLAKEEKLKSLHDEGLQLQESLRRKVEKFQSLEKKQDAMCAPPDLAGTLRTLKEANKQALESSEEFAEQWVENGSADVDTFLREFLEQRKLHHERAAKMEILQQRGVKSLR